MQRLGKYELRGAIGRGAMGTVYTAWDTVLDRRVAIKTAGLSDQPDRATEENVSRFRQEARLAGRLTHPGIVGIYDFGETDDLAYIVMEFVEGETLKAVLDRGEPLGVPRALDIIQQMLAALGYCHEHGIVHRDLKPSNLMLSRDGRVKLTDFGVARTGSSDLTLDGSLIGTPAYMSPEQFTAKYPADQRTDIYASGVICYELLTGKRPFDGDLARIMHQVLSESPVPPSQRSPTVPARLDAAVLRALARRPDDRFGTATAFAVSLQASVPPGGRADGGDTTIIAPPTQRERDPVPPPAASEAAPPPRIGLVLTGGLAIVALLGGGLAWWLVSGPTPHPHPVPSPPSGTTKEAQQFSPATVSLATPRPAPVVTQPRAVAPSPPAVVSPPPLQAAPAPQSADLAASLAALDCSTITGRWHPDAPRLVLSGLIGTGAPSVALASIIAHFGGDSVRNEVTPFPASVAFCHAADIARSTLAPGPDAGLRLALHGDVRRLLANNPIQLDLRMADFEGELRVDYLTGGDGTTAHAVPLHGSPPRYAAGAEIKLGATGDGAIGTANAPYGTDMILAVASSLPLFTTPRPTAEASGLYLDQLQAAISAVRQQGGLVSVSVLVLETAER